jgi:hypothetical protein
MFRPWENMNVASSSSPNDTLTLQPKKKHLCLHAKQILRNVYQGLLKRGLVSSVALTETCYFTKTPLSTVRDAVLKPLHARKERNDKGTFRKVDGGDKDLIRRKIYAMYQENLVPTIRSLKARLALDDTNISCSITSLWRIVSQMGFKYKKINKRQVLMESQRLQKWRYEYLIKIREYRSLSRPIIYERGSIHTKPLQKDGLIYPINARAKLHQIKEKGLPSFMQDRRMDGSRMFCCSPRKILKILH